MSGFEVCTVALVAGALAPASVLAARGRPSTRLVGLQLASSVSVALFLVLSEVGGFTFELIVPLVLVVLSFAGALVYTRLLSPHGGAER